MIIVVLMVILMFYQQEWSIKYDQDQPVAPRFDENAPDLYIPGIYLFKSRKHFFKGSEKFYIQY